MQTTQRNTKGRNEMVTGMKGYYPEMGEARPDAAIEARLAHYGKHYFLSSQVRLAGRGVCYLKTLAPADLTPQGQRKVGWHEYKVTLAAFERICREHAVAVEFLL